METLRLELEDHNPPAPIAALIEDADRRGNEIYERAGETRMPLFAPSSGLIIYRLLRAARDASILLPGMRFCEWGSGLGLVTMLAAHLGLDACGIEIEPELVSEAKRLAAEHGIDVNFYCTSIFPRDNPQSSSELCRRYAELDAVFVYPWPREVDVNADLFTDHCKANAVLVLYHGGLQYNFLRNRQ